MTRIVKNSIKKFTTPGNHTADLSNPRATANIPYFSPTQKANLMAAQEKLRSEGDYRGARLIGRDAMGTGTMRFVGHDLEGNDIIEGPELPDVTSPPSERTRDHFAKLAREKQKDAAKETAKLAEEAARKAKNIEKDSPRVDPRPIRPLPVDPRPIYQLPVEPRPLPSQAPSPVATNSTPINSMRPTNDSSKPMGLKRGGKVNSASSRGDGIAQRGKTRGKMC